MRAYLAIIAPIALVACGVHDHAQRFAVASPPAQLEDAFSAAGDYELPLQEPIEVDGLLNVVFLGDNIISGDEPDDEHSFARLQSWGVRSILSVDGKVPDEQTAQRFGMRYVHIPIAYKGITETQLVQISKTFRELEGPFYVHCFHGKHRGPAAAAVGRLVLDGIPREQAIAEMRQYCSTSAKYPGLYSTVATAQLPSAEQSSHSSFAFDAAHRFEGLRASMTRMARLKDRLETALDRDWAPDPAHPDADALQDAIQLHQHLVGSATFGINGQDDDYDAWMQASTRDAAKLSAALLEGLGSEGPPPKDWQGRAVSAFEAMEANCIACHEAHRNR